MKKFLVISCLVLTSLSIHTLACAEERGQIHIKSTMGGQRTDGIYYVTINQSPLIEVPGSLNGAWVNTPYIVQSMTISFTGKSYGKPYCENIPLNLDNTNCKGAEITAGQTLVIKGYFQDNTTANSCLFSADLHCYYEARK